MVAWNSQFVLTIRFLKLFVRNVFVIHSERFRTIKDSDVADEADTEGAEGFESTNTS